MTRWLITILLLIGSLVAGIYLFSAQLATSLAIWLADRQGIQVHRLELQRPGFTELRIDSIHVTMATYDLRATGVALHYDLGAWRSQPVTRATIQQLAVMVAPAAPDASPDDHGSSPDDLNPVVLFSLLPDLAIERLSLQTAEPAFAGEGSFRFDQRGGALELVGLQPEAAQNIRVMAALRPDGQLDFSLFDAVQTSKPFLYVTTVMADDEISAQARFELSGYPLALVSRLLDLPVGSGQVRGQAATSFADLDAMASYLQAQVDGEFLIDWQDDALQLKNVAGSFAGTAADMEISFSGGKLTAMATETTFTLDSGTALQYRSDQLTIGPGVMMTFQGIEDLDFQARLSSTSIHMEEDAVALRAVATADIAAFDLSTRAAIEAELDLIGSQLRAELDVRVAEIQLPVQLQYDLVEERGRFSATSQFATKGLAKRLFMNWPYPVEINAGQLGLQLQGSWEDALSGTFALQLERAVLQVDDYVLNKVAGQLSFLFDDNGLALRTSPLRIGEIDVGVPVQDLQFNLAWRDDTVRITEGHFRMLGGHVVAAPFDYSIDAGQAAVDLRVEDLDLAEVLALEGDDIKGTGRLSGSLPVRINANEVTMSNGQIRASEAGGRIELSPSFTVGSGQPGIDFALTALNNFTYTALSATADYLPSGDLKLAVNLQGRNPAVEKGRPIHYNLTINENLFSLMESLEAQSGITKDIERRVRK